MPESSNKGGRKPRATDEDLLDVFRSTSDPVLSTAEVADAVPIKRRGTLNRLQALEEDGDLESKQIGGRNTVWWLVDDRDVSDTGRQRSTDAARESDESTGETPARTSPAGNTGDSTNADTDRLTAVLDTLDATDDRRAAVRACVEYLREHGTAQKSGFIDDVYPDHAAGYGSAGGWWNKIGKEYLNAVADEYAAVAAPEKEGAHTWRWVE